MANYVLDHTGQSVNTKLTKAENTDNKVTSISSSSTDTQYPTAKAVYDEFKVRTSFVTPEQYGAVGDGVADDTAAINNCLAQNKAIMFLGQYKINTIANAGPSTGENYGITIPSHRTLVFSGGSKIICTSNASNHYIAFCIKDVEDILIDGLDLQCDRTKEAIVKIKNEGSSDEGVGILIRGSKNIVIKNSKIYNSLGDGIGIWASGNEAIENSYTPSENIFFDNCEFHDNRRNSITIGPAKNIKISNCNIYNNGLNITYEDLLTDPELIAAMSEKGYSTPYNTEALIYLSNRNLTVDGNNIIAPGISPRAGIDIEPNYAHNEVKGVVIENCYFYGNGGFDFVNVGGGETNALTTIQKDICLINCRSESDLALNDCKGIYLGQGNITVFGGSFSYIGASNKADIINIDSAIIKDIAPASKANKLNLNGCYLTEGNIYNGGTDCQINCYSCILDNFSPITMQASGIVKLQDCYVHPKTNKRIILNGHLIAKNTIFDFKDHVATDYYILEATSFNISDCDFYYPDDLRIELFNKVNVVDTTYDKPSSFINNNFHNSLASGNLYGFNALGGTLINNYFNFPKSKLTNVGSVQKNNIWSDTDDDLDTFTPKTLTVTLSSSGWSNNTITVTANGVTASNTIMVTPEPASIAAAAASQVYCSNQASNSLTFTCLGDQPSTNITMNVVILKS